MHVRAEALGATIGIFAVYAAIFGVWGRLFGPSRLWVLFLVLAGHVGVTAAFWPVRVRDRARIVWAFLAVVCLALAWGATMVATALIK